MNTNDTDDGDYSPNTRVNKEELEKAQRLVKRFPNIGFDKMFAHNPPIRVVVVEDEGT